MDMNFGELLDLDRGQHDGKHIAIYYSFNITIVNGRYC